MTEDNDFFFSAFKENPGHCIKAFVPAVRLKNLGDMGFKKRHALTYPYIAGAMANGISSAAMVKTMAQNGMMGFLGVIPVWFENEAPITRSKSASFMK